MNDLAIIKGHNIISESERPAYTMISNSQVRSYLSCRRKWWLERQKYPREFKDFFAIGSLVHVGVAEYYRGGDIAFIKTSMESEMYKGQLVNEVSISLLNIAEVEELELMKYLHTRMPEVKIELNKDLIFHNE